LTVRRLPIAGGEGEGEGKGRGLKASATERKEHYPIAIFSRWRSRKKKEKLSQFAGLEKDQLSPLRFRSETKKKGGERRGKRGDIYTIEEKFSYRLVRNFDSPGCERKEKEKKEWLQRLRFKVRVQRGRKEKREKEKKTGGPSHRPADLESSF